MSNHQAPLARLCFIWVVAFSPISIALELAIVPMVDAEVVHDQLSPVSSELNKHFPGTYIHTPKDLNDYLNRYDSMDITYADEAIASQLITDHGYIPLLVTNEVVKATLVSMSNYTFSELNRKPDVIVSVNKNDLLITGFAMTGLWKKHKFKFFDSNTNLMISLLKNKQMVGALPEEDIDLLPITLKSKLSSFHQRKLSPIYFIIHPKHKPISKKLQNVLYKFHKHWDRSQAKYSYLNYYTLKKIPQDEYDYLKQESLYKKYKRIRKLLEDQL